MARLVPVVELILETGEKLSWIACSSDVMWWGDDEPWIVVQGSCCCFCGLK